MKINLADTRAGVSGLYSHHLKKTALKACLPQLARKAGQLKNREIKKSLVAFAL
jgi:hypothetical protein